MMKPSRTICRLILPFLFAVLLTLGIYIIDFSRNPANDDIAEDILRFDLMSGEKKTAQVCSWSGNGKDFYLFLPSFANPDNTVFMPLHNAELTLDGHVFQKGDRLSSLSESGSYPMKVSGHFAEDLTLTVMQSATIPSLFVINSSRAIERVHADKNHKEKTSIILLTENGSVEYEGHGLNEIKGRGNSSWYLDKKPYHLNLSTSIPLLGMSSSRHWILLSNGYDKTNLRNKLVYDYAGKTALPWTPECRYVDLFINGGYDGLYLLSEQVEFDTRRINPADSENSFLAEITQMRKIWKHDYYFQSENGRCFKIVEPDTYKSKRFSSICQTLQQTEDAILSLTEDSPWPDILDLDSFVRRYLIDEIFLNLDSDESSSYYFWDASAQKMFAYPIWDYDLSCGNSSHSSTILTAFPEQLYSKYAPYYRKLYANREFFSRMTELYRTEFLPLLETLIEKDLSDLESLIARSNLMNMVRWAEMYQEMRDGQESDAAKIAELHRFLQQRDVFLRATWLDMKEYVSVWICSNDGSLTSLFTTEKGAKADSIPSPASFGIADSNRWYAENADIPLNPETLLTERLSVYPSPYSVRATMSKRRKHIPEDWEKANRPIDYIIRLIRHDGKIVIPLSCLLLLLAVMSLYALLNSRKTGGRRK